MESTVCCNGIACRRFNHVLESDPAGQLCLGQGRFFSRSVVVSHRTQPAFCFSGQSDLAVDDQAGYFLLLVFSTDACLSMVDAIAKAVDDIFCAANQLLGQFGIGGG